MNNRNRGGIFRWLTSRLNRVVRNMITRAIPGGGRGSSRGYNNRGRNSMDIGMDSYNTPKRSKNNKEDSTEKPVNYIDDVGGLTNESDIQVRPIYQYSAKDGEIEDDESLGDLNEEGSLVNGDNVKEEDKDLWETEDITEKDKGYYKERLEEMATESKDSRKDLVRYYKELSHNKETPEGKELDSIREQIYNLIPLNQLEQVPNFLTNGAEIEEKIKQSIKTDLQPEAKDKAVEDELKRYRDSIKDFMELSVKDEKYFITDWKLGIKVIGFMVNECGFPEIILLLTPSKVDEMIKVMRTGYLPDYLRHTPFEKMLLIFERLATVMEKDKISNKYSFPKAYYAYKQQLPMYTKLRNNGRLANVNTVLGFFYQAIDSVEVNGDVEGDAYLGLIEPVEFIHAYTQFFYGRAKQTQAMSDVSLKLMKKDPTILQEVGEKGYAIGSTPKGSVFIVTGHLIVMVNVGGDQYNIILNKAPSDITTEDITNITGMFATASKKGKQGKQAKSEPKKVTQPPKQKTKGLSYDYESAMKAFSKDKKKQTK